MAKDINKKKDNLNNEINDLKKRLSVYVKDDLDILKDYNEIKEEKKDLKKLYKSEKSKHLKKSAIKNLATTAHTVLVSFPIILVVGGTIGFSIAGYNFPVITVGDSVYVDNTGYEYRIEYNLEEYSSIVKTPWELENAELIRKVYQTDMSIDYDEKDELLSKDYKEVLASDEYEFVRTEKNEYTNNPEDIKDNKGIVGITTFKPINNKDEYTNSDKVSSAVIGGSLGLLGSGLSALILWWLNESVLYDVINNLYRKKIDYDVDSRKNNLKKLKKEYKSRK